MKLHVGSPGPVNFKMALHLLGDSEFKNLTRSTIPLLCYWAHAERRLAEICDRLDCAVPPDCAVCFEYPAASLGGSKPSFTDVMCVSEELAIAVEGKSTEGKYESVGKWLARGGENRKKVLTHWLGLIGQVTGFKVDPSDLKRFEDVTYQMIHRTASACSLEARRTAVVYQVFDVGDAKALTEDGYKEALTRLAATTYATGKLDIQLQIIKTDRTDRYHNVAECLVSLSEAEKPKIIRRAVLDGGLFEFGSERRPEIFSSGPSI